MEPISSDELCDQTRATYRQIDYWCRVGVLEPLGETTPGSGKRRKWDPGIVPAVRVLVAVSDVFRRNTSAYVLKKIFENYQDGKVDFDSGITLSWVVESGSGDNQV